LPQIPDIKDANFMEPYEEKQNPAIKIVGQLIVNPQLITKAKLSCLFYSKYDYITAYWSVLWSKTNAKYWNNNDKIPTSKHCVGEGWV
jgi:hypothetical protein